MNKNFKNIIDHLKRQFISYISLIVALTTLWFTLLRPFSPDVNFGGLFLIPKYEEKTKKVQLKVGVPIIFYNKGATSGLIEDIAIKMESSGQHKFAVLFFPYTFYESHQWLINKLKNEPEVLALKEVFSGIYLPPHELQFKEILFGMEPTTQPLEIRPGDYVFTLYIKLKGNNFEVFDRRVEKITQDTINNMGNETITVLLPYLWRENLKETELHK